MSHAERTSICVSVCCADDTAAAAEVSAVDAAAVAAAAAEVSAVDAAAAAEVSAGPEVDSSDSIWFQSVRDSCSSAEQRS